ncbi:INO80 complex subunit C isoform X1 [Drosophila novamexicana]|uniref:INO80 complex subunit C isoform X1 n=1 Tax=Drosophila novamexicana TaxID=47314 RepID=UPI0011E5DE40|nr:INO80 complex subunit C isoform X1 [Drosophila novamexicana]
MMDTNSLHKPKRSFKRLFAFPRNCVYRPLRQIHNMERNQKPPADQPTYFTLNAPPSLLPAKKYSDISGLPAPYVDPHSKLRYANADEYASMQHLPSDIINGYLTLRGYTSAVG